MSRYRRATIENGTFFFTLTLVDRSSDLLVRHIERLRHIYSYVQRNHRFTTVAICVLPDHLHAIWTLPLGDADFAGRWSRIKSGFSRGLPTADSRTLSKVRKRERGIWQRRYWEHAIRDEADLERHVDYVHYNPVKHGLVPSARDWPYSSFHRYVARGIWRLTGAVTYMMQWEHLARDDVGTARSAPLPTLRRSIRHRAFQAQWKARSKR